MASLKLLSRSVPSKRQQRLTSSLLRFSSSSTSDASPPIPSPKENTLVVIGGGLSGLSTAYYFLKALTPLAKQHTKIIVLEKQDRTGGWCNSTSIDLGEEKTLVKGSGGDKGELVFESGPRSIRPVGLIGWLTIEMAHTIGLTPQMLTVSKSAPSAKNRYVYYPSSLTLLPSSLASALSSLVTRPLLRRALPGILSEPFRARSPLHKREDGGDESVDAFFKRRFGKPLAENMISAMIHGIYSGDTRRLSVRTVFPALWEIEREWRSLILYALFGGMWKRITGAKATQYQIKQEGDKKEMEGIITTLSSEGEGGITLVESMQKASVWGVKGGLEKMTDCLREWLKTRGVEFRMGESGTLESLERDEKTGEWMINTTTSHLRATHLITTLPSLLPPSLAPPAVPATTVSVLNIAFPATKKPLFPPGFGYLIPRSVKRTKNPWYALGVIFDGDVMPGVDSTTLGHGAADSVNRGNGVESSATTTSSGKAALTKISILSGGSYWLPPSSPPSPLPSHSQLLSNGLNTLALHFPSTRFPVPIHSHSVTHVDCIPQSPPYHHLAMRELGEKLRAIGRTGVVGGGGVGSVGINGAVRSAWEVGGSFGREVSRVAEGGKGGEGEIKVGTEIWE